MASIGFLMAQAIGRWGNFFNQEAFGIATGSDFFGMTSEPIAMELGAGVMAHPCFLYEFIWCAIGFLLLHIYSKKRKFKGEIFLMYLAWYGFGRFFIEALRTDQLKVGPVPVSMLVSGLTCVAAVVLILFLRKKLIVPVKQGPEYKPVFQDVANAMRSGRPEENEAVADVAEEESMDGEALTEPEEKDDIDGEIDLDLSDLPEITGDDADGEDKE